MSSESLLPFLAAGLSLLLGVAGILWKRNNLASWSFALGMTALAVDAVLSGMWSADPERFADIRNAGLMAKVAITAIWLCFSAVYSRGDAQQSLRRALPVIVLAAAVPIVMAALFPTELVQVRADPQTGQAFLQFGRVAKVINAIVLLGTVLVLMNLERTFRAAVGTMQWRIKFLILGLAIVFGARIYTRSQALVFSGHLSSLGQVETIALLIGCMLMAVGYFRSGFGEIDVYPSRVVLHTSITVLLAGGYLFVVGVLAQVVARSGGGSAFQAEAFLVLIGIALLAVLLLSQRLRQRVKNFVSRHFQRPRYDFRAVWARFTEATANASDDESLCGAAGQLISRTFNVMSVSIWLSEEDKERLVLAGSTAASRADAAETSVSFEGELPEAPKVFDLEKAKAPWSETLRHITRSQFGGGGGNRICISLRAADRWLGFAVLADRVNGAPYSAEEFELLGCIGDQLASNLLNLRLASKLMLGKELEAFQTISAFFVHDLKNAASTLNLMLQNFPIHYEDPAFRADALRGIGETTARINQIVERLSAVRNKLELRQQEVDLNALVTQALHEVDGAPRIALNKNLAPLPRLVADPEQIRSVVTNLLLNARDAIADEGRIDVSTAVRNGWVTLSVSDNGCGMNADFLRDSLFRPFKTTKKKGLGIGMFQTKAIVEAHHGYLRVQSEPGKGSAFEVAFPLPQQV